jgi:hypothetical protein
LGLSIVLVIQFKCKQTVMKQLVQADDGVPGAAFSFGIAAWGFKRNAASAGDPSGAFLCYHSCYLPFCWTLLFLVTPWRDPTIVHLFPKPAIAVDGNCKVVSAHSILKIATWQAFYFDRLFIRSINARTAVQVFASICTSQSMKADLYCSTARFSISPCTAVMLSLGMNRMP